MVRSHLGKFNYQKSGASDRFKVFAGHTLARAIATADVHCSTPPNTQSARFNVESTVVSEGQS